MFIKKGITFHWKSKKSEIFIWIVFILAVSEFTLFILGSTFFLKYPSHSLLEHIQKLKTKNIESFSPFIVNTFKY